MKKNTIRFQTQFDNIDQAFAHEADRFGFFDVCDDQIDACIDFDPNIDVNNFHIKYAHHFLALTLVDIVKAKESDHLDRVLDAICRANWRLGAVAMMSENESTEGMCIPCIIKRHASENGKAGADKKFAPLRKLKEWTILEYQAGSWPSANKAAHELQKRVLEKGRSMNVNLSEENAQRTIAEWIRNSKIKSV